MTRLHGRSGADHVPWSTILGAVVSVIAIVLGLRFGLAGLAGTLAIGLFALLISAAIISARRPRALAPSAAAPPVASGRAAIEGPELAARLSAVIRDVADFPREGILFKDLTTLFGDAGAFHDAIDALVEAHRDSRIDVVVGVESRGFVIGGAVAYLLEAGFVPVRKAGKLPHTTLSVEYALEYGTATLQIHTDAIRAGQRVLVVDDLLATGGTAAATVSLVERLGGQIVGVAFLVELAALDGARHLGNHPRVSLIRF